MSLRLWVRAVAIGALAALPGLAHCAGLFRAYLSSTGSDANPCTLAAPCRLLPAALAAVQDGGEIWMLDSANYNTGPVDIPKSVTILAVPGAVGSVVANVGDAIDIATPGVKVVLRNLVIVPFRSPTANPGIGVYMTAGAGLVVENCLIADISIGGIGAQAGADVLVDRSTIRGNGTGIYLATGARATITNSVVTDNHDYGIHLDGYTPLTGIPGIATSADIADTVVAGSTYGIYASSNDATTAPVKVSVRRSRIVRNSSWGLSTTALSTAPVTLSASENVISGNFVGVFTQSLAVPSASKAWLSGNAVTENGTGLYNFSGVVESAGDNAVRNNTNNKLGTISPVTTQ